MGWDETHAYYRILREVEAELDARADATVLWRDAYTVAFSDVRMLRRALHRRWRLLVETQIELAFTRDGRPARELRTLARAHPGLVRFVASDDARWAPLLAAVRPARRRRCPVRVALGRGPAGTPIGASA